jgi:hypothetical protein
MCIDYIMICWVETSSTPPFIGYGGRVYMKDSIQLLLYSTELYLYLPSLQDSIYNYLLNRLGYGPPDSCPQAERTDSSVLT